MPDTPHIAGELDLIRRTNARVDPRRMSAGPARNHLQERLDHNPGRIGAPPPSAYEPPAFLRRVVGREQANVLRDLLLAMKARNDEHVGEPATEVAVLLNGDPSILAVREQLRTWVDNYVDRRIARGHPKDNGDPVRTYARLYDELTPWLESVAFRSDVDTLHPLYLSEATDYLPWRLFRDTWGRSITMTTFDHRVCIDWGTIAPGVHPLLAETLKLYSWLPDPTLRYLAERLDHSVDGPLTADELAADLAEMRPLLVRNYRPERSVIQLTEDLFVAWNWSLDHRLGIVYVAGSERELLERIATGSSVLAATVGFDGSVSRFNLPWLRLSELPGGANASLRLVEAFHSRLLAFYDRIDLDALLRAPPEAPTEHEELPEDPADRDDVRVAASVDLLRRRTSKAGRLGVRTSELLSVLQTLGCETRQGKGSEVSLYRPGARIWSLKHHKRNARHGWSEIRQILKRLEISVDTWLQAVDGGTPGSTTESSR